MRKKKVFHLLLMFMIIISTVNVPLNVKAEGENPLNCSVIDFDNIRTLTVDKNGNIYIVEHVTSQNKLYIKEIDSQGQVTVLTEVNTEPYKFRFVTDSNGHLYWYELNSGKNIIKKFNIETKEIKEIVTGKIFIDIAVDGNGNVYYTDYNENALFKLNTNEINAVPERVFMDWEIPYLLANDVFGNVYAVTKNATTNQVKSHKLTGQSIESRVINFSIGYSFNVPLPIADTDGNFYYAYENYMGKGMVKVSHLDGKQTNISTAANPVTVLAVDQSKYFYGAGFVYDGPYFQGSYVSQLSAEDGSLIKNIGLRTKQTQIVSGINDETKEVGENAEFSVVAETCEGNLTYEWYKDDEIIQNATSPNYSIQNVSLSDAGTYTVKVKDSNNNIVESSATLTVNTSLPRVETKDAENIIATEAQLNGQVNSNGGNEITDYGFVYSTTQNPELGNESSKQVSLGSLLETGQYNTNVTNLSSNTTYYYRAYAVNSKGTSYGDVVTFTTEQLQVSLPFVTTSNVVSNVNSTEARISGMVNDNGNDQLRDRGFVYSTSSNPEIGMINSKQVSVPPILETGEYNALLNELSPNTIYYYRAFAENSKGIGYGNVESFRTQNNDANLISLTLSPAGLKETFESNQLNYSAIVPTGTSKVTVSATASDINAKVSVNNGVTTNHKIDSQEVTLEEDGSTEILITVIAENGLVQKVYRINVTESALLDEVTNVQLSDTGIASWNTVENADNYEVQLYKDEIAIGESIVTNQIEHNFLGKMRDAGAGEFTVTVIAKGNNSSYSDSQVSEKSNSQTVIKLDTVTGLTWDKTIAKWSPLLNANTYDVQLYKANETIGNIENVIPFEINFIEKINQNGIGLYKYIVSAKGDNKLILDGNPSEFSDTIVASKVTYNGNGNDSGDVPTDNQVYVQGVSVTVAGNAGNLGKSNYSFLGWNTSADGEGTNYRQGDSFPMGNENVTLYAQWEVNDITNPTIQLHGDQIMYIELGTQYVEPGYSAYDIEDGDLTSRVIVSGTVENDTLGTYELKYNVSDNSGNQAEEVTRSVQVVSPKLKILTVSAGNLVPSFDPIKDSYTLSVPFNTETLNIDASTLDPTANININDTEIGDSGTATIPLIIGSNTVTILVTTRGGITKTYSLVVTKELPTPTPIPNPTPTPGNNGGENSGGNPPTSGNGSNTEIITVDVDGENGELLNKTPIQRTTESTGTVKDFVTMPNNIAKETVQKAIESGNETASIIIPDEKDIVSEVRVEIPEISLEELKNGNLNLGIFTENATILIPKSSLQDINDDLYFRLVPIKKEEERKQVEERAKKEEIVKEVLGSGNIEVLARPMTIETNLTSRKVDLILPLLGVKLPEDPTEQKEFLDDLAIFIEHSDGDRVLVRPELVTYKKGLQGLKFTIEKFSTFTIVKMDNLDDYFNNHGIHNIYIKGYGNGEFRPGAPIYRDEMATMLGRNLNATPSAKPYADTPTTHWAYGEIMEVKGAGIMTGRSTTTFDSKGYMTRAEMATIAYRWIQKQCEQDATSFNSCLKLTNIPSANFKDVSNNHWAIEAINFTKNTGIMVGDGKNKFRPNDNITRAEAVKVLNQLFQRGPLTNVDKPTFIDVPKTHWAFGEIEEAAKEHSITLDDIRN